jgi:hypothetical protein
MGSVLFDMNSSDSHGCAIEQRLREAAGKILRVIVELTQAVLNGQPF